MSARVRIDDEMSEFLELFHLIGGLEDIMPVHSASGTIHLHLRTQDDVQRLAEAIERTRALHNRLVQQGKIAGRIIP